MRHHPGNIIWSLLWAGLILAGCSTVTVRTTEQAPLVLESPDQVPEDRLLDVGIGIFNPGIEGSDAAGDSAVFPEIRRAEARYIPVRLAATLQNTGAWGAVRVIPERQSETDVWVDGAILQSDGETLALRVTVQDASNQVWFEKIYRQTTSKYAYDREVVHAREPFQGIYNALANDMLAHWQSLPPEAIKRLRAITELRFARRFAPDAFADHLQMDAQDRYRIVRLPAENDPLLERIRRIRTRDDLFVDTLQDYYALFARQMQEPYLQWRAESYQEHIELRKIQGSATRRIAGGTLAVLGGLAAFIVPAVGVTSSPTATSLGGLAGAVGIGAGTMLIKSGLAKRAEAKLHRESLREIAVSLDAEIEPHSIALEDRTVTLTGTVRQQYRQWREILAEMYRRETGMSSGDPVNPSSRTD